MCQSSKKPRRFSFLRVLCGEKSGLIPQSAIDTFFLLTPPLVILCVVSSKTGFSEHFRYVLPCFPFLFIVTTMGLKPSPSGESFRFLYWGDGKLPNEFAQSL